MDRNRSSRNTSGQGIYVTNPSIELLHTKENNKDLALALSEQKRLCSNYIIQNNNCSKENLALRALIVKYDSAIAVILTKYRNALSLLVKSSTEITESAQMLASIQVEKQKINISSTIDINVDLSDWSKLTDDSIRTALDLPSINEVKSSSEEKSLSQSSITEAMITDDQPIVQNSYQYHDLNTIQEVTEASSSLPDFTNSVKKSTPNLSRPVSIIAQGGNLSSDSPDEEWTPVDNTLNIPQIQCSSTSTPYTPIGLRPLRNRSNYKNDVIPQCDTKYVTLRCKNPTIARHSSPVVLLRRLKIPTNKSPNKENNDDHSQTQSGSQIKDLSNDFSHKISLTPLSTSSQVDCGSRTMRATNMSKIIGERCRNIGNDTDESPLFRSTMKRSIIARKLSDVISDNSSTSSADHELDTEMNYHQQMSKESINSREPTPLRRTTRRNATQSLKEPSLRKKLRRSK